MHVTNIDEWNNRTPMASCNNSRMRGWSDYNTKGGCMAYGLSKAQVFERLFEGMRGHSSGGCFCGTWRGRLYLELV